MPKARKNTSPKVLRLSVEKFRPYGQLIRYPGQQRKSSRRNLFRIVVKENNPTGWRIACLIVRDKQLRRLEQHPFSHESFEPVQGRSLLLVARRKSAMSIRCFLLDRPVVVKKGIWHGIGILQEPEEMSGFVSSPS